MPLSKEGKACLKSLGECVISWALLHGGRGPFTSPCRLHVWDIHPLPFSIDARRAVELLEEFCGKLEPGDDADHADTLRGTIHILQSDLFLQLIGIQKDYRDVSQHTTS